MKYKVLVNIEKQVELTIEADSEDEAREVAIDEWNSLCSDNETETVTDIEIL